jgi:enamine deaminase RidA (YjgF/YER057c/UK114 family)
VTPTDRLRELGLELPPVFPPAASYVGCARAGDTLYVSGHGPISGDRTVRGKVGRDLTLQEGREAARLTALSILATIQAAIGSIDQVERILKVLGMVNAAPGFTQMPAVIDGASELFIAVFGDAGRHARSAVGMAELPSDIAVEIELIALVR